MVMPASLRFILKTSLPSSCIACAAQCPCLHGVLSIIISSTYMHLTAGGWCYSPEDCATRAAGEYGSSTVWRPFEVHEGYYSPNEQINPMFYNWNVITLLYCDGSSFTGDRASPMLLPNGKTLYFRCACFGCYLLVFRLSVSWRRCHYCCSSLLCIKTAASFKLLKWHNHSVL